MADFGNKRWAKFVPDIGENRSLAQPFFLKVRSGISKAELQAFFARWDAFAAKEGTSVDGTLEVFGDLITMGEEPLVIDGKPIPTLRDYILFMQDHCSVEPFLELCHAVPYFNSVEGTRALFYERLSGGSAFTAESSTGRAATRKPNH